MYGTRNLVQFVQWIQRDGIVRTEDALVEEVIRELKLPGPASAWALSRIKDVIQEARHQAQRKDTPVAKKPPSRPKTRPASEVSEPKQSAKTSPSTPPGILAPSSTPRGIPRGRCPIVPGHALSVYGTPDLIQFVQWIQRDGIVRTEDALVEKVIRELKLPGPASVWALSRIKDVIQEARHQAQRKDTPVAKKSPSRPSTRPASDGAARSRLSELAFELLNHGIQVRLAESEDVLIVHGPASIASAAGGRIEASISSGYFVWGAALPRSTHPIADHRGAAQAVLATGASSAQEKTKAADAAATPVRTRPTCPVPRGRSIFAYTDYELIAFVKWMKDDGIQRSKDQLIRDVIDELSSSTQTVGALQRVRQALRDVGDHEVLVPKAAIGAVGGRERPTGSRSPRASKPSGNHRSAASRSRSGRPITAYKQEELVAMIRTLADNGHANTYDDLIDNMISELKLPARTPLRVQIIEEAAAAAGWISRSDDETGALGEASFTDVIAWARAKRYELETDKEIPEHVVFQYNHTHPGRPYAPRNRRP
ncbi:UNVERIFIED_ORG: hypothetical protein FHR35_006968 [Microbispora rosea subsp. rosea]